MSKKLLDQTLLFSQGIDTVSRSFSFTGEIDDKSFEIVDIKMTILEQANKKAPITIKLNSPGGAVTAAWSIASRIQRSTCPVNIEVHGEASSAATIILACGKKRSVSRFSTLVFHETRFDEVTGKLSDLKDLVTRWTREQHVYATFLASKSKKSAKFWNRVMNTKKDIYLTPAQLLAMGLIDEVF